MGLVAQRLQASDSRPQARPRAGAAEGLSWGLGPGVWSLAALAVLGSLGLAGAARAQELSTSRVELDVAAARQSARGGALELPFSVRADEQLAAASAVVELAAEKSASLPDGLEVWLNRARVARFDAASLRQPALAFDLPSAALADRSLLELRAPGQGPSRCGAAAASLGAVRSVALSLRIRRAPLPANLSLLPLPFVDREADRQATLAFALGSASPEEVRLAGLVAGWFGLSSPVPLRFEVTVGELPPGRAVALVGSADSARALGLPPPKGPALALFEHPRGARGERLLALEGRTPAELAAAVAGLLRPARPLTGAFAQPSPTSAPPPAAPYGAPRWASTEKPLLFSELAKAPLVHRGQQDGTLTVHFRVAPDLWTWSARPLRLDLDYRVELPDGAPAPALEVAVNGRRVAPLPLPAGAAVARAHLRLSPGDLRGYNALTVGIHFDAPCGPSAEKERAGAVEVLGSSALHLEGLLHYARLPDVQRFVHDGFPFTRAPDLGDTAVVLPAEPSPSEIAAFLGFAAYFAQVTGLAPERAQLLFADAVGSGPLDKDLLLIGTQADHALLARWAERLPLSLSGEAGRAQRPAQAAAVLDLLRLGRGARELARAREWIAAEGVAAAVAQVASPLAPGRSAVAVMARSRGELPSPHDLRRTADSRYGGGDLLAESPRGQLASFSIGDLYGAGDLSALERARLFTAEHWALLVPSALFGALLLAVPAHRSLSRRGRERLEPKAFEKRP